MNLDAARNYAIECLTNDVPETHCYHDIIHTRDAVVPIALEIGRSEHLAQRDLALIETAAWFHDIGFLHTNNEHEQMSCDIAGTVLTKWDYGQDDINQIQAMIMATRLPQTPSGLLAAILCDADLNVLGQPNFRQRNKLLRQEMGNRGHLFSDAAWYSSQWRFAVEHRYHTNGARKWFNQAKVLSTQYLLDCMLQIQADVA